MRNLILAMGLLFAALGQALAAEPPAVASFKEGTGVILPEETKAALGLSVVEVEERKLTRRLELTAQVYRAAGERAGSRTEPAGFAYASTWVKTDSAQGLEPGLQVRGAEGGAAIGRVLRLDRSMVEQGGGVEVLLQLDDNDASRQVGDFVRIAVTPAEPGAAVAVIPWSSVLATAEGKFVYVRNGAAWLRTGVTLGARDGGVVEVVDGLYAGDQVAAGAAEALYLIELRATKGGGHSH